jgi:hypothetical protein
MNVVFTRSGTSYVNAKLHCIGVCWGRLLETRTKVPWLSGQSLEFLFMVLKQSKTWLRYIVTVLSI